MDFEEIINEIMSLDPKIRYVGIVFDNMRLAKMRPGVANLLTPEETQEMMRRERGLQDRYEEHQLTR